jgi:hypothetical protein
VVYKVLAHAQCPVMTLSPLVLADCEPREARVHSDEIYMAGVF